MPSRNITKQYQENSFYHIYNRGVNKGQIYTDDLDYKMFLSYLKNYLVAPYTEQVRPVRKSFLYENIKLIAFVLMPNHFHLLVKQKTATAIIQFMRSLTNAYTRYFNSRHERVGPLFQGRYKGVLINEDPYLLHLTRYLHLNPLATQNPSRSDLQKILVHSYSSYADYLGLRKSTWLFPGEVLAFFNSAQKTKLIDVLSYQSFVEDFVVNSKEVLGELVLED